MSWLQRLFARRRMESDLDKELQFHFESQVADKMRSGIPESEARRLTRLEFGGIERIKEDCRERRGTMWLESLLQDLRYALRQVHNAPGFTLTAVLTLALGIGATTAIFTLVQQVMLQSLPVTRPVSFGASATNSVAAIGVDTARKVTASRTTGVCFRGRHTSSSAPTPPVSRTWRRSRRETCSWPCGEPARLELPIQPTASLFLATFFRPWVYPRGAAGC